MFRLSKPDRESINAFIRSQRARPFSYAEVGGTRGSPPRGYTVDHNRVKLGEGSDRFDRARGAIEHWKMFEMSWVELCWPDRPIEADATVAVLASHLGFWSLCAC